MPKAELAHLIIIKADALSRDVGAFVVDRQARGLSPRTVQFYRDELANLRAFLQAQGITETKRVDAGHLRAFLLDLGKRRNPGGVHAGCCHSD